MLAAISETLSEIERSLNLQPYRSVDATNIQTVTQQMKQINAKLRTCQRKTQCTFLFNECYQPKGTGCEHQYKKGEDGKFSTKLLDENGTADAGWTRNENPAEYFKVNEDNTVSLSKFGLNYDNPIYIHDEGKYKTYIESVVTKLDTYINEQASWWKNLFSPKIQFDAWTDDTMYINWKSLGCLSYSENHIETVETPHSLGMALSLILFQGYDEDKWLTIKNAVVKYLFETPDITTKDFLRVAIPVCKSHVDKLEGDLVWLKLWNEAQHDSTFTELNTLIIWFHSIACPVVGKSKNKTVTNEFHQTIFDTWKQQNKKLAKKWNIVLDACVFNETVSL